MNVIFDEYPGQVVPIRYHVWWPSGNDPFYLFDTLAVQTRVSYYCCSYPWDEYLYVPNFRFDGKYIKDPSDFSTYDEWYAWVRNTIDSLLTIPSPIRINIVDNYQDADSVYVTFDVIADSSVAFNMRLHLAVTEWRHRYPFPVGKHDHPFRHFEPDNDGYALTMNQGDSLRFNWSYPVDPEYRVDRLVTNIFIQRSGTKKIQQAAREQVPDISSVEWLDIAEPAMLGRNSPNPFNGQTKISYSMSTGGNVRLSVYTLTGRLVTELVDGYVAEGSHLVTWDGRDRFGREVGSGVYYYRLETDRTSQVGKMILLR